MALEPLACNLVESMAVNIVACGAWGSGFTNFPELIKLFGEPSGGQSASPSSGPKPAIIPANERRRAPLSVRLAVETSHQATQSAAIDPKQLSSVFVSGFGDTQLTDYMCKVLATDNKQLSPTKFHNSVHNAAAGYWTISTGCERSANSVAGFHESVPLALMEAIVQCNQENIPILFTVYDAPVTDILTDILGIGSAFSCSLIIAPERTEYVGQRLALRIVPDQNPWPELHTEHSLLRDIYRSSPAGRILAIVEQLFIANAVTDNSDSEKILKNTLCIPLGAGTSLLVTADKTYEN